MVGAVCKSSAHNVTLKIWVIRHVAGTKFCPCNISPLHDPSTCPLMCLEYIRTPIYFIVHLSLDIVSCSGGEACVIVLTLQVMQLTCRLSQIRKKSSGLPYGSTNLWDKSFFIYFFSLYNKPRFFTKIFPKSTKLSPFQYSESFPFPSCFMPQKLG